MKVVFATLLMGLSLQVFCQDKSAKEKTSFIDEVTSLAVRLRNNEPIEVSTLYDSLVSIVPEDSKESIFLAESLKRKGFKVIDWGSGNFPPNGVRIFTLTLKKDKCQCVVSKVYYITITEGSYMIHESIACNRL